MVYVLDTNAVSGLIRQNESLMEKVSDVIDKGEKIFVSVITDYEIRRGLFAVNATKKLQIYEMLRNQYYILWIDDLRVSGMAAEIHADLRRKGLLIQDADILIAAAALAENLTLVTDDAHFQRIPSLRVENWLRD